jgi:hypothetical protein
VILHEGGRVTVRSINEPFRRFSAEAVYENCRSGFIWKDRQAGAAEEVGMM